MFPCSIADKISIFPFSVFESAFQIVTPTTFGSVDVMGNIRVPSRMHILARMNAFAIVGSYTPLFRMMLKLFAIRAGECFCRVNWRAPYALPHMHE